MSTHLYAEKKTHGRVLNLLVVLTFIYLYTVIIWYGRRAAIPRCILRGGNYIYIYICIEYTTIPLRGILIRFKYFRPLTVVVFLNTYVTSVLLLLLFTYRYRWLCSVNLHNDNNNNIITIIIITMITVCINGRKKNPISIRTYDS